MIADNVLFATTTHDDDALLAENRVQQPDIDQLEHSLVPFRTDNIWQDHQRLQFLQQVNTWNMMSYKMWGMQHQQHVIPMYGNAWGMANNMSLGVNCRAPTENVFLLCPCPHVHLLENQGFPFSLQTFTMTHTLSTTPKSSSKSSNTKKQKRARIQYTNDQIFILESTFQNNKYLNRMMRERLANELGITEKHVKTWFQNRRRR
ncbi:homeobox protein Hox-B2a-like [Metopolophium dirhodum]|uniref:homeobox protein Hox-B2a-like n=1 Tax=Metopolophium dirhodum TaxID=44670 RepID=UPI0029900236|nr:homeobox protein Hox-B2a-like [Metopolophium dirhodum]